MSKTTGLTTLAFLALMWLSTSSAQQPGRLLFVNGQDPTCNGRSPCYRTIQSAINAAQTRDTIQIQAGVYPEQLVIEKNNFPGLTESDRIIIESDPSLPPGSVTVTGSPGLQCTDKFALKFKQSKFVTVRGLTITGTGGQAISLMGGNNGNEHIHIERNRIFGNGSSSCNGGITVARGNPGTLIVNNLIYANGRNGIAFIDADGGPHYIVNNTIYGNQWNGIDVSRGHEVFIVNNIINRNGTMSGSTGGRFGVQREGSTNPVPQRIHLLNNLLCGNKGGEINGPALDATDSGNLSPEGSEEQGVTASPGCEIPAQVFANPSDLDNWPNSADDDFTLATSSPAIDGGMDPRTLGLGVALNAILEADYSTDAIRPSDGDADRIPAFDIGAYEFPNSRPIAIAGLDQNTYRGALVTLDGTGSRDPDGAPLTFQWTIISQPDGSTVSLPNQTTSRPQFVPLVLGKYVFQLVVNDGELNSAPATVQVNVANNAPIAKSNSLQTLEDTPLIITLSASDLDDAALKFVITGGTAHGILGSVSAPNCVGKGTGSSCTATVQYTPNANYSGLDSFGFRANDGGADSNTATISITVAAVNDAPTADSATATTSEDMPVVVTLSGGDIDTATLSFAIASGPSHGRLGTVSPANCAPDAAGSTCTATVEYNPDSNYNGLDNFTFKANDGANDSQPALISIVITPVNNAPVAQDQMVTTNEDAAVTVALSATDIDSSDLQFILISGPSKGTVGDVAMPYCTANGSSSSCSVHITYTPAANYSGSDTFSFKVSDGNLQSNLATVFITVNAVDDAPLAADDVYNTDEDTPLNIFAPGVLGNDNDIDTPNSGLTAIVVTAPKHAASFELKADGSFTYVPAINFNGTDAFTYKVNDGTNDSNVAAVTIAVNAVNDAPVATNDVYYSDEDTPLDVGARGVLANDNDVDTPAEAITAMLLTGPSHALSFTLNPDGSFTYVPAANFNGADSFTYQANDGGKDSNAAMVTITVIARNDAPVAENDTYSVAEDTVLAEPSPGVLGNDSDIDGDQNLSVELVSGPAHATDFELKADGSFTYLPAPDFNGVDTFTYRLFDGAAYSNVAMAQVTVSPINDRPVAQSQSLSTNDNTPAIITLAGSDVDSSNLNFSIVNAPSHGVLTTSSGTMSCTSRGQGSTCAASIGYTPAGNYSGPDSFTFKVSDGLLSSNTGTVSITVIHINRPPTAYAGGPYTGNAGAPIQFAGSGTDPDGDLLAFMWNFGDGATASGVNPIHIYTTPGVFTVTLIVSDPTGATAAAQTTTTVGIGLDLTSFSPSTGPVGTEVTIQGNGFDTAPGKTIVRFNGVQAIITSISESTIKTFVPLGATTGPVTVATTVIATSSNNFVVALRQDFGLSVSPAVAVAVQGGSRSYAVNILNTGSDPFAGVATLSTSSLPAGVTATFTPRTLGANATGVLTFATTNSTPLGSTAIEVQATSQLEGHSVTRTAVMTLTVGAPGETVLTGEVRDENEQPLLGVSIKLGGATLIELGTSDAAGTFFIPLSVVGPQVFLIDGSSANTPAVTYSTIPITLDIKPNTVNSLGFTPHLHAHATAKLIPFTPGQQTVITTPEIPGFKMTIPAGVQIIGWDGQPNNRVSVTPVPIDRSPLPPLPAGLSARQIYIFNFGKMGGGVPTGNIPIDTPNDVDGLPADKVDLYYFNEAPDGTAPNRWEKYGTGTVSSDGARIVTDINPSTGLAYGIPRFCCGARVNIPPPPPPRPGGGPSGGQSGAGQMAGEPVDTATGFFYVDKTDMVLPGILPIAIIRTYRSQLTNAGPFGLSTSWPYDIFLQPPPNGSPDALVLFTPGNRQDIFSRQADGSFINNTAPSLKGAAVTATGSFRSLRFKDGSLWRFDAGGKIISQSDRNGNMVTLTRDTQGRVMRITEPSGRQMILSYTGTNLRIDRIQDPIGRQILYSYDASGRLITVTDAAGGLTRYTYDTSNRIVSITDPRGITFLTNDYDSAGKVIRQTQADGGVWTFSYETTGSFISQTTVTNPSGHGTTYRFNSAGYLISETDALGQTTNFERQAGTNLLLSTTDPLGRVASFTYDANGNPATITDPEGNVRRLEYESTFNKVTRATDPLGNVTSFTYDTRGNLTTMTDPLGARTTIAYNSFGLPVSTTDALGNSSTFTYDSGGNLAVISNSLGNNTQKSYDLASRLIEQTDPHGRSTRFAYDSMNRIAQVVDALGALTSFSYDGNGNLLTMTDARGNTVNHSYDVMDRVASKTDQLGITETYEYDAMGNVSRHIDRKGQTNTFSYDALNRRTTGSFADGATTSFAYDRGGRLIEAADSVGGTILTSYDKLDRLVAEATAAGTINYQYDALGRRTRMDVPGQSAVMYSYDAASRLRQVLQGSRVVDIQYDALGRRTLLTLPNSVSTEYQYDTASRLTALIYRNSLGVVGDLTYEYDRAGYRTAVGGSFARTLLPDSITATTYDAANRQRQLGDKTMTFDANGNLNSIIEPSGATNFNWDARNRLVGLSGPAANGSFVYDVLGRRTERNIGLQGVQFLYDGFNPVQETRGASVGAHILTGLGIDEYFTRTELPAGAARYFLSDALGSTVSLADAAGVVQTEYTYEPFGKTGAAGESNSNRFEFTGRESDDTGLYYYRARYYHPGLQRFISEDPIGYAGGDVNLFGYTSNSPTNFRDPSGKFIPVAVVGATLCATGAVTGAAAYHALSGRKSTFLGFLAGAAAGCVGGIGLGWAIGIGVEAMFPSLMVAGGEAQLWAGVSATFASAEAAVYGRAVVGSTFSGSALTLSQNIGLISRDIAYEVMQSLSANFVSGAGSASVLLGPEANAAKTFFTHELPVLVGNGASIAIQYVH